MPGKKNDQGRGETVESAPAAASAPVRIELTDALAVASAPPVPISFRGQDYAVKRGYTPAEVLEFFDLFKVHKHEEILQMLICEGDPVELWEAIGKRSPAEFFNVYLPNLCKLAGLMNAAGEFLAP